MRIKLETKELIEKIKHNIDWHMKPYNLGDMGETETLILDALSRLEKLEAQTAKGGQAEVRVMPKIAEVLNKMIKEFANTKYESLNEQPITNDNWNKMIKQSENYGAYKTLIELRKKFAEIDSNFTA